MRNPAGQLSCERCPVGRNERGAEQPVLMPATVHDFITGRPSRAKLFDDFFGYAKQHEGAVFTTHDEVRKWWMSNYESQNLLK